MWLVTEGGLSLKVACEVCSLAKAYDENVFQTNRLGWVMSESLHQPINIHLRATAL